MHISTLRGAAALLLVPGALAAQDVIGTPDDRTRRVDAVFADYDKPDAPGCAVGVYRDGQIAYARGYGLADLERRVPITPRTVFDLGSTSKQFTASAILLLAQEGKLSLDDDVRKWIPELPQYERPVTLRHLLHHTGGLRDYILLFSMGGVRIDDVTTEADALAALARQRAPEFAAGDEYLYSNTGYFLLSEVVKRASGKHLRDFARERIFAPLGMTRTHILSDYADVVRDRALAYDRREDGSWRTDLPRWLQTGDGAVFSTVEELLLWDRNFYDPRVGGEALLTGLQTVGRLANGQELTYAAGLMIGQHRGMRTVRHTGSWGGYRSELLRMPDAHFSVAVLCNTGTTQPGLARAVAEIYLEDRMQPVAPPPPAAATASSAPAVRVAPERLQALAGSYRDPVSYSGRTVAFEDGTLWMGTGPSRWELRPRSETEFEAIGASIPTRVRFEPAAAGRPVRVTVSGEGRPASTAEKLALVTPAAEELPAYAGAFFSEELQTTWRVTVENGVLTGHARGTDPTPLRPMQRDEFTGLGVMQFTRDASGAVTGFQMTLGRLRNVLFTRVGA
jgi:CubicO group peptidase (beta-lactamase class C family)